MAAYELSTAMFILGFHLRHVQRTAKVKGAVCSLYHTYNWFKLAY